MARERDDGDGVEEDAKKLRAAQYILNEAEKKGYKLGET